MFDALKSIDAEQNILGTLILDSDSQKYLSEINEEYFTENLHKAIFNSIKKLYSDGSQIDYFIVNEELKKKEIPSQLTYLIELGNGAIKSISNEHINILKDKYKRRKLSYELHRAIEQIYNLESDITGLTSTTAAKLDLINFDDEIVDDSPKSVVQRVREDLKKATDLEKLDQYRYGLSELDALTAGLHPEETTTIAADTGVGKTAFALQIALRMATKGLKVFIISREMSDVQVMKRILTSLSGIDGSKFRTRQFTVKEWEKIEGLLQNIESDLPLHINTSCSTISEIKSRLRQLKADVLIIDYLQLITPEQSEGTREREVAKISRELKNISLDFKIPVIQLSQVGPDGNTRESRAIEQDSNNVIKLIKPDERLLEKIVNNTKNNITWSLIEEARRKDTEIVQVILEKQRDGRTGKFLLFYIKNRLTFKSIPNV